MPAAGATINSTLFRREALEQLAAPDEFGEGLRVVGRAGWLALAACLALVAGALAWSVLGSYRVSVAGQGLLVRQGGMFVDVYAPKPGWLAGLANVGDDIHRGDLIAHLQAPEDDTRVAEAEARLRQLAAQRDAIATRYQERLAAERRALAERRASLTESASLSERRIAEAERTLANRAKLLASGHGTEDRVTEARERLFAAREALARTRADIQALDSPVLAIASQRDQEAEAIERQIRETEGQLAQARLVRSLATEIRSPEAGHVVMTPVTRHALVTAGQRLLTFETGPEQLEALIYIPEDRAKRVQLGMEARLTPTTARREEYGTLIGQVVAISPVPQGQAEIADRLSNQDLARRFAANGAPFQMRVALRRDPADPAHYAWTSRRGRDEITLSSGMLLSAQVTVRKAPPITLLIPALRRWLGL